MRLAFFFISTLCMSSAYKILFLSPIPGKSHAILGDGIVKHLASAGHEITYITALLPDFTHPNVSVVAVVDTLEDFGEDGVTNIGSAMDKKVKYDFTHFIPMLMRVSRGTVANEKVQKLLSDKTKHYDVFISEWMFNEAYAGFSGVFNCPLIWFSTVDPHWMILHLIDEYPNPSYNVDIMSNGVPPLSFTQRITELYLQIYGTLIRKFYVQKIQNEIYETLIVPHYRTTPVPRLEDLMYNASLVLSNSHTSTGIATRLPPNFISIGGYHIDPVVKPLPEDLQKIMDNAKHGVIYFSMGSNLRSKHFPDEVKQGLLKIFGELKQIVLWKFEEDLPNRPSNVHILKWAPQPSILAHKNCILFITHGGLLSTTETIHYGVPIIAIPVFADQFVNADKSVQKGYAKKVDLSHNLVSDLKFAIQEMLSDKRYTERVKELSRIYHDRPILPEKELVHWVEHVVKTGGALHLRTPAFQMPWYQKVYLDLALVILSALTAIIYALKYLFSLCSKNKRNKVKKN